MFTVKLTQGLGDCIVAGGVIQEYAKLKNERVKFITNPLLECVFKDHPQIEFATTGTPDIELKWASQLNVNVFPLHTTQRFSTQLGFYSDPTSTLDIHNKDITSIELHNKELVINTHSKDLTRRFLPEKIINKIESHAQVFGYKIKYVGNCNGRDSECDIMTMMKLMKSCKLFIGPVSFPYHLASALKTKSLTFFSFMPEWKFSDFINTRGIQSDRPCVPLCETHERKMRSEENCFSMCKATDYDNDKLNTILREMLP